MVHIPNFTKLREAIKTNREHFDMADLFVIDHRRVNDPGGNYQPAHDGGFLSAIYSGEADLTKCGTAACLCGWAYGFSANNGELPTVVYLDNRAIMWSRARYWLGLTDNEASYLFEGEWSPKGLEADADETIAYLDKIIADGELSDYDNGWDEPEERY
jgi:hypothetical protein